MEDEAKSPSKATDIEALKSNVEMAVAEFARRWISVPTFTKYCEVMDQRQLRDAMGLRATIDAGDPWPQAEQLLLSMGFRWHWLSSSRVMYLQERDDFVPDTGWEDGNSLELSVES